MVANSDLSSIMASFVLRMGGRAVEYTGLENRPRDKAYSHCSVFHLAISVSPGKSHRTEDFIPRRFRLKKKSFDTAFFSLTAAVSEELNKI